MARHEEAQRRGARLRARELAHTHVQHAPYARTHVRTHDTHTHTHTNTTFVARYVQRASIIAFGGDALFFHRLFLRFLFHVSLTLSYLIPLASFSSTFFITISSSSSISSTTTISSFSSSYAIAMLRCIEDTRRLCMVTFKWQKRSTSIVQIENRLSMLILLH